MKRILELVLVFVLLSSALACIGGLLPNGNGDNGNGSGELEPTNYDPDYGDDDYESKESTTAAPGTTEEPTEGTDEPSVESTTPDDSDLEDQINDLKDKVDNNQPYVEMIPCIFLSCNFEEGSMCMYRNLGPPAGPEKDGPSGPLAGSYVGQPSPDDFSEAQDIIDVASELDAAEGPSDGDTGFKKRKRKLKMRIRRKRLPQYAYSWQTVTGRFGNRVTGVREAAEGSYYSAAYIRPQQTAAFEARVIRLSEDIKIEFQAYEGVSGMRMQVCCETKEPRQIVKCGFETEQFVGPMGYHEWQPVEASCPAGTERIVFICENKDKHQGACAVDNIKVTAEECPQLTSKANQILRRRRKHRKRRRH